MSNRNLPPNVQKMIADAIEACEDVEDDLSTSDYPSDIHSLLEIREDFARGIDGIKNRLLQIKCAVDRI